MKVQKALWTGRVSANSCDVSMSGDVSVGQAGPMKTEEQAETEDIL